MAKKSKALKPSGRPPFEITKDVLDKVEGMAATGMNQRQIAQALGIHEDTFCLKKKAYSDFSEALARGKSKGIQAISSALFRNATLPSKMNPYGNVGAQTFYLKAKAGWAESSTPEGYETQEFILRRTRPAR